MNREDESRFEKLAEKAVRRALGRRDDEIAYHAARAAEEIDRGLTAGCPEAARAHLRLSTLHSDKIREMSGTSWRPPFVL